jgi:magnesium transporter
VAPGDDLRAPVSTALRAEVVTLRAAETVEEALARLRSGRIGERIVYLYVTDEEGRLTGVVPTRRLLLAGPGTRVEAIMVQPVVSVPVTATVREAMEVLAGRRLLAAPVVDAEGRIAGVIDLANYAGEALDLERRETADELFQLVGVHVEQERRATVAASFRSRFPWLFCNIAGGMAAALISGAFQEVLREAVVVAFFVPIVLAVSESVAMQSATVALQSIHLEGVFLGPAPGALGRQVAVGTLLGLASGAVAGALGWAWLRAPRLGLAVGGGILLGAAAGAAVGSAFPRLVRRWKLDPSVASGPAALAATDMVALVGYLALASVVLSP